MKALTTSELYERCPNMVPGQINKGSIAKYIFICEQCGFEYESYLTVRMKGKVRCTECTRSDRRISLEEAYERFPDMVPGQKWEGSGGRYTFICGVCERPYMQIFSNHASGRGCAECANNVPLTTESMYERCPDLAPGQVAKGVGFKYIFLCERHGNYEQTLSLHSKTRSCPLCANGILTTESMYERCPDLAPGQVAKGTKVKYRFICEEHGEYEQQFSAHSRGQSCPIHARLGVVVTFVVPPIAPAILEKLTALGIRPRFEFLNVDVIAAAAQ